MSAILNTQNVTKPLFSGVTGCSEMSFIDSTDTRAKQSLIVWIIKTGNQNMPHVHNLNKYTLLRIFICSLLLLVYQICSLARLSCFWSSWRTFSNADALTYIKLRG